MFPIGKEDVYDRKFQKKRYDIDKNKGEFDKYNNLKNPYDSASYADLERFSNARSLIN